jgi:undecaprenyl-diphosphatase
VRPFDLDHLARAWVVGHRLPILDPILLGISLAGAEGLIWLVVGAALALTRRIPARAFGQLGASLLLSWLLVERLIKPAVGRGRPFIHDSAFAVIGPSPHGPSFPSGHAAVAFAGAYVLSQVAPRGRSVWWSLAALIAYSRVYLGVHYPIDVVFGAMTGLACAGAVMWLSESAVAS